MRFFLDFYINNSSALTSIKQNEHIIIYENTMILSQVPVIPLNNSLLHMTRSGPKYKGLGTEAPTFLANSKN